MEGMDSRSATAACRREGRYREAAATLKIGTAAAPKQNMKILLDWETMRQRLKESAPLVGTCEEARPDCCRLCGAAARREGGGLVLVGHGRYYREIAKVWVRRYRCLECLVTFGVLPVHVHPRRWFSVWMMLLSLHLVLVCGVPPGKLADSLGVAREYQGTEVECWKARARRWGRGLLDRLWPGLGRRQGIAGPARGREEQHRRLSLLLKDCGVSDTMRCDPLSPSALARIARSLHGSVRTEA